MCWFQCCRDCDTYLYLISQIQHWCFHYWMILYFEGEKNLVKWTIQWLTQKNISYLFCFWINQYFEQISWINKCPHHKSSSHVAQHWFLIQSPLTITFYTLPLWIHPPTNQFSILDPNKVTDTLCSICTQCSLYRYAPSYQLTEQAMPCCSFKIMQKVTIQMFHHLCSPLLEWAANSTWTTEAITSFKK